VSVFRQKFTLKDDIGSHACSLEANTRVTYGIPLGCSLFLPVHNINCVQTLKAVNFLSNTFKSDAYGGGKGSVGALALGGGSTQIALALSPSAATPAAVPDVLTVRVNGREFELYTASFLGYGFRSFNTKIMSLSTQWNGGTTDPCLLYGTPAVC
jgi:hypothetical protein